MTQGFAGLEAAVLVTYTEFRAGHRKNQTPYGLLGLKKWVCFA